MIFVKRAGTGDPGCQSEGTRCQLINYFILKCGTRLVPVPKFNKNNYFIFNCALFKGIWLKIGPIFSEKISYRYKYIDFCRQTSPKSW